MSNNSMKMISNLGQWFMSRRCLKDCYLELYWPSFSVERNHLCNFERGHHGEHLHEVIRNLDRLFRTICYLKHFLSRGTFM